MSEKVELGGNASARLYRHMTHQGPITRSQKEGYMQLHTIAACHTFMVFIPRPFGALANFDPPSGFQKMRDYGPHLQE